MQFRIPINIQPIWFPYKFENLRSALSGFPAKWLFVFANTRPILSGFPTKCISEKIIAKAVKFGSGRSVLSYTRAVQSVVMYIRRFMTTLFTPTEFQSTLLKWCNIKMVFPTHLIIAVEAVFTFGLFNLLSMAYSIICPLDTEV